MIEEKRINQRVESLRTQEIRREIVNETIRYCPNCGNAREFSEQELYVIRTRGAIQCGKCLFVPQWLTEPPKIEEKKVKGG